MNPWISSLPFYFPDLSLCPSAWFLFQSCCFGEGFSTAGHPLRRLVHEPTPFTLYLHFKHIATNNHQQNLHFFHPFTFFRSLIIQSMNFVKVFISSGVAFFMAILVALLIETFGGAVGSVIGTLPSTIIPAAYILLTEESKSVEERTESMIACLFGMLATDILFMPCWKVIPPKLPKKWSNGLKVLVTSLISLLVWFIGTVVMILLKTGAAKVGLNIWVFGLLIMLVCGTCGVCLCWTLPPTPAGKNKVKLHIHLMRGLAAAIAIFVSGILSQTGLGIIAGAMVTFPAIFLTTMVSVSLAQGADVSTGAIGPMLFGGMS